MNLFQSIQQQSSNLKTEHINYVLSRFTDPLSFESFADALISEISAKRHSISKNLENQVTELASIYSDLEEISQLLNHERITDKYGLLNSLKNKLQQKKEFIRGDLLSKRVLLDNKKMAVHTQTPDYYPAIDQLMEGHFELTNEIDGLSYAVVLLNLLYAKEQQDNRKVNTINTFNKDYALKAKLSQWNSYFISKFDNRFDELYFKHAEIEATPTNLTLIIPSKEIFSEFNNKILKGRMMIDFEKENIVKTSELYYSSTKVELEYVVDKELMKTDYSELKKPREQTMERSDLKTFKKIVNEIDYLSRIHRTPKHLIGSILTSKFPLRFVSSSNPSIDAYEFINQDGKIYVDVSLVGKISSKYHKIKIVASYIV